MVPVSAEKMRWVWFGDVTDTTRKMVPQPVPETELVEYKGEKVPLLSMSPGVPFTIRLFGILLRAWVGHTPVRSVYTVTVWGSVSPPSIASLLERACEAGETPGVLLVKAEVTTPILLTEERTYYEPLPSEEEES